MAKLLPEWYPQWGTMLAWPNSNTTAQNQLAHIETCYAQIASIILNEQFLLIVCTDDKHQQHIQQLLASIGAKTSGIKWHHASYNSLWVRSYGPIAMGNNHDFELFDFAFNGFGKQVNAVDDDQVNASIPWQKTLNRHDDIILEGTNIATDGRGNVLTNTQALLNDTKNTGFDKNALKLQLKERLNIPHIWCLNNGFLSGCRFDSGITSMARFCNSRTLAYSQCTDPEDEHYQSLQQMQKELFAIAAEESLDLVPLPLPFQCEQEQRLPATYTSFIILNRTVLVPIYGCGTDRAAISQIASAMPEYQIKAINCRALLNIGASLHAITLPLAAGAI